MRQTSTLTRNLTAAQEAHANHENEIGYRKLAFRLYTEDKNRSLLTFLTRSYFPKGATITYGHGIYTNAVEASACIEIIANVPDYAKVHALAEAIKHQNAQSSVLLSLTHVWTKDI